VAWRIFAKQERGSRLCEQSGTLVLSHTQGARQPYETEVVGAIQRLAALHIHFLPGEGVRREAGFMARRPPRAPRTEVPAMRRDALPVLRTAACDCRGASSGTLDMRLDAEE